LLVAATILAVDFVDQLFDIGVATGAAAAGIANLCHFINFLTVMLFDGFADNRIGDVETVTHRFSGALVYRFILIRIVSLFQSSTSGNHFCSRRLPVYRDY
jgi:hypothetical protein